MTTLLIILLIVSFLYYLHFLFTILTGLLRHSVSPNQARSPDPLVQVSIVIAARNEEATIAHCLGALQQQRYPLECIEVIVVDDHSTDATLTVARDALQAFPVHKLLTLSGNENKTGKPAAIACALQNSRHDLHLFTDADSFPSPDWVASMVKQFDENVAFVAGPVLERQTKTVLSALSSLEFLGLITTAAGLIAAEKPIICNGANIAYTKRAFQTAGGFGDRLGSCDDETIMQRINHRKLGSVRFNFDPSSLVVTAPPQSVRQFWHQRTRWASKHGHYEDRRILWKLLGLYSYFLLMFIAGIGIFFDHTLLQVVLPILFLKAAADYSILSLGASLFQTRFSLTYFLIAELFHVPYIAIAAFVGQCASLRWKNRMITL